MNCVGFHNYKFFLMLLFYAGLACLLIAASYWEAVVHAASNVTTGFAYLYSIFVAFFLAAVLAIVLLSFLTFHMLWLVIPNFTTIEFCEKRKDPSSVYSSYSPFSHGCKENFYATMGKNCLLWFFPFSRIDAPNPLRIRKETRKGWHGVPLQRALPPRVHAGVMTTYLPHYIFQNYYFILI